MGLIHAPGPAWQFEVDNLAGNPPAAVPGAAFTCGGNNVDGAAVGVLAALAADIYYLVIAIGGINTANENNSAKVDILIDRAGGTSWSVLIADLVAGAVTAHTATIGNTLWYHFPLWIPAGAALGVRGQKVGISSSTAACVMYGFGRPKRPDMWWCGQGVETVGPSTHTPGNSNAFSAYASVGSATARRFGALQVGIDGTDASMTGGLGYYFQIGIAGSQIPGTPTIYMASSTTETLARTALASPIWCDIPAATQLQARGAGSGTSEVFNVGIYGVY